MSGQPWSQPSVPEETWTTVPSTDHSTWSQPLDNGWYDSGVPVTAQDLQAFDAAAWLSVSHGSVDLGLSPDLSYESQSTRTLNSVSEPEVPVLPAGLDLSFVGEPAWDFLGPAYGSSLMIHGMAQDCSTDLLSQAPHGVAFGQPMFYPQSGHRSQPVMCAAPQPLSHYPMDQVPYPRRIVSDPSVTPGRLLLPRREAPASHVLPTNGQYRTLQPQPRAAPSSRVSSVSDQALGSVTVGPLSVQPSGHVSFMPEPNGLSMSAHPAMGPGSQGTMYNARPLAHMPESDARGAVRSNIFEAVHKPTLHPMLSVDTNAMRPEMDGTGAHQGFPSNGHASEIEEGRYRSHPLYNEGPRSDGMYHCPFAHDASCQHQPTKLKCNYDKFIDSHLKPFRCKIESCATQAFSSTACLLRHEREAHGMHGHGDRPHLCYYAGCERGHPGNGFPRRYNLFDHMKRVHDHKEESGPGSQEADTEANSQRKPASRKRKATGSAAGEPSAHRPRVLPKSSQPSPVSAVSPVVLLPAPAVTQDLSASPQDLRRDSYLQHAWNSQRERVEYQMQSVRSPDDEAGLDLLSQNLQELRRLSQQARRG